MGVFQNNLMGAAAAAASAGGGGFYTHQIANSLRNSAAQDGNLTFTAGTPTSSTTFTMSYWVKRYNTSGGGSDNLVFTTGTGGGTYLFWGFQATDFNLQPAGGNWAGGSMNSDAMYRDTSAWYHQVLTFDSTNSTQADRLKVYVNGERITSWSSESVTSAIGASEAISFINEDGVVQAFGGLSGKGHGTVGADLQLAEIVFNDGQAYGPDSYGETKNGVWIPKDPSGLTFGNNGYWLNFAASGDLGNDVSGNNNDFTVANIAAHDQMLDSPTFGSEGSANFPAFSPLYYTQSTNITEGNLDFVSTGNIEGGLTNAVIPAGEATVYYFEWCVTVSGGGHEVYIGVNGLNIDMSGSSERGGRDEATCWGFLTQPSGYQYVQAGSFDGRSEVSLTISTGDVVGMVIDRANTTIKWYINNSLKVTSTNLIATGDLAVWSGKGGGTTNVGGILNAGQDSSFAGQKTAGGNADSNGFGDFFYTPPTGTVAYCTGNLPIADEIDPAQTDDDYPQELFFMSEYSGNGTGRTITTENKPDLIWLRSANTAQDWYVVDSTRVITNNKYILTNTTALEATLPQGNFTSVGATSVGISSGTWLNSNGSNYKMWMWRANGGTTVTNTTGSANSTVQVDPSGGFSIVKWTGTSDSWSNAITLGHGLSSAPTCIIAKKYLGNADQWEVFFSDYGSVSTGGATAAHASLTLNSDSALYTNQSYKGWGGVMPTLSPPVFTVDGNNLNGASDTIIAYCFANTEGYIKSGSYVGNANADGPFVYTGFKPAFVINKPLVAGNWRLVDSQRSPYNVTQNALSPNNANAEDTYASVNIDLLSNGFKMRNSGTPMNQATTYVYLAFAENPFKYATAR